MSTPLVAVITRTRNRPVFLARALASVRAQRFADWVHVIVNDGGDVAEVERVARGVKTEFVHLEGVGRGRAANEGLANSRSSLVVFHDDDDSWHPDFLSRAVETWRSSKRRGVVTASERVVERVENQRITELRREPFFPEVGAISLPLLARENCFINLAFLAERAAIEEVGGYDAELPLYEDWDFNLRFVHRFDVAFLPEVLARYHHREAADGDARNSFAQDAAKAADARAVIINRWLREPSRQHIGLLMALGPSLQAVDGVRERVDKLFNLLHGARQSWPLRTLESLLQRRR